MFEVNLISLVIFTLVIIVLTLFFYWLIKTADRVHSAGQMLDEARSSRDSCHKYVRDIEQIRSSANSQAWKDSDLEKKNLMRDLENVQQRIEAMHLRLLSLEKREP